MSRLAKLNHQFVEYIPTKLDEGTLYLSIPFATAVHLCCCGCAHEVVTPLSPTDWELTFDGESVSLNPSIGNWGFPCKSHYWIRHGRVRWARKWSDDEVAAGRERDARRKHAHYHRGEPGPACSGHDVDRPKRPKGRRSTRALWELLRRWWHP